MTGGTLTQWPVYNSNDFNHGFFKREGARDAGWGGEYIPEWAWSSGGGPSELQTPAIDFHVTCLTCAVLGVTNLNNYTFAGVRAYPVPAADYLSIEFHNAQAAETTIRIISMTGAIVVETKSGAVKDGTARISTAGLPDGVYLYKLSNAGGADYSGRFTINHG